MTCATVSLRLSALLDGELSAADAAALELHLKSCARCRRERAEMSDLQALLAGDSADPASAELAQVRLRLRRALVREEGTRPSLHISGHDAGHISGDTVAASRTHWLRFLKQAAGFVLLLALLAPLVPLAGNSLQRNATPQVSLVASLSAQAHSVGERLKPWLMNLPDLHLPKPPPEGLFTERIEDIGDRALLAGFDILVDIGKAPAQPVR